MTAFDLYSLKENLSNYLRDVFYPRNTIEGSVSGTIKGEILAQSFKPLSTYHNSPFVGSIHVRSLSQYNDLVIDLCSNGNNIPGSTLASTTIPVSSIPSDFTWLRFSLSPNLDLESSSTYWLQFRTSPGSIVAECFEFKANSEYLLGELYTYDGTIWSGNTCSLQFVLEPPNWIYPSYPRNDLGLFCYDERTEVLTPEGWKKISEIKNNEVIMCYDPGQDQLRFEPILDLYSYDYVGPMMEIKHRSLDLLVTPNHRLLFFTPNGKMIVKLAFERYCSGYMLRTGQWKGQEIDSITIPEFREKLKSSVRVYPALKIPVEKYLRLLGWYLSEGSPYTWGISIAQRNPENRKEIEDLLQSLGLPYAKDQKGFRVLSRQLGNHFMKLGKTRSKFIPKEIKDLSPRLLKILIDTLLKGDGLVRKDEICYYSSSERLANDFQEIALKSGYGVSLYKRRESEYTVRIFKRGRRTWPRREHYRLISQWKGKVYCPRTNTGFILVRRNGHVVISGNSFPRIAVDIVDRPRVVQRWIDHRLADYELAIAIVLYSRYLKELDQLLSYTDRALWKKRANLSGFRILNPAKISSVMIPRAGIFARVLNFVGVYRQKGE